MTTHREYKIAEKRRNLERDARRLLKQLTSGMMLDSELPSLIVVHNHKPLDFNTVFKRRI